MFKRIVLASAIGISALSMCAPALAAKPIKNLLPKADWAKYGVNPWRLDTDNDGYPDFWEVKNGYCPTNQGAIPKDDPECKKGSFTIKTGVYSAPAAVHPFEPDAFVQYKTCGALTSAINTLSPLSIKTADGSTLDSYAYASVIFPAPMLNPSSTFPDLIQSSGFLPNANSLTVGSRMFSVVDGKLEFYNVADTANPKLLASASTAAMVSVAKIVVQNDRVLVFGSNTVRLNKMRAVGENDSMERNMVETVMQEWKINKNNSLTLQRTVDLEGIMVAQSATNEFAYVIIKSPIFYTATNSTVVSTPLYKDSAVKNKNGVYVPLVACSAVRVLPSVLSFDYTTIVAIPLKNTKQPISSSVVAGQTSAVHLSFDNAYLFSTTLRTLKNGETADDVESGVLLRQTEINKFNLFGNKIVFQTSQTVPGIVPSSNVVTESVGKETILRLAVYRPNTLSDAAYRTFAYFFDGDLNRVGSWGMSTNGVPFYAPVVDNEMYLETTNAADKVQVLDVTDPRAPASSSLIDISAAPVLQ